MTLDKTMQERAILADIEQEGPFGASFVDLDELATLAETAGAKAVARVVQKRARPDPATFLGQGKVQEIAALLREKEANLVLFDDELSPAQLRNLEEQLGVKVLDRTALILDIFAARARTKEAKLQVEMAQLRYLLPRLSGKGSQLSRLAGGIGTRGPGESKLETDRRRIRHRLGVLASELREVRRSRELQRRPRQRTGNPFIALVGYTNAGKSTLFNCLTGAPVEMKDALFCTLDPTVRGLILPNRQEVFLSDTVGFIHKLPHHLVDAFRATLEETVQADLLLHVMDASHPQAEQQQAVVYRVLHELGVGDKPLIEVVNKIDLVENEFTVPRLLAGGNKGIAVSAKTGQGVDRLLQAIMAALAEQVQHTSFIIPYSAGRIRALVHRKGRVIKEEYLPAGVYVEAEIDRIWAGRIRGMIGDTSRESK